MSDQLAAGSSASRPRVAHVGAAPSPPAHADLAHFHQQVIEQLPEAVYICDADGRIQLYNRAAVELWGREPKIGHDLWCGSLKILHPDGSLMPLAQCPMAVALAEGRGVRDVELVIERPDGSRRSVLPHPSPIRDGDGVVIGAVNLLVDITDRRRAEQERRDLQSRLAADALAKTHAEDALRLATQTGKVGLWDWDVRTNHVSWTDSLYAIHGVPREQFAATAESFVALVHPDDRDDVAASIRRTLEEGAPYELEFRAVRPDGQVIWLYTSARAVCEAGQPVRLIGATMDITDRKRAELELAATKDDLTLQVKALTRLHELSTRLQGASEPAPALHSILQTIVELHDADFGLVSLHDPASGFLRDAASIGFAHAALQTLARIMPGENVGACGSAFATRKRAMVEDVETDRRFDGYRDGARAAGFRAVHSTPILTRGGEILGVLCVHFRNCRTPTAREMQLADLCARYAADIIEDSRAQKALRESEARFRTLASHAPVGIFLTDVNGDCLFVNQTWCRLAGLTPQEAQGRGWARALHPDDRQRVFDSWYQAVRRRVPFDCEYRFCRPDGAASWVQGSAIEMRDPEGQISGYIGTTVDITARKAAEAALTEAKDVAEAANRSKDRFLAVLSHELRTPLTPVLMAVAARQNDPDLPADVREDIAMIRRNVELETKLIDDLLDLSRITSGKLRLNPQAVDLNDAVRHVCAICRPQILEKGISLHCALDPGACAVTADPARLQQVLWNVIKNAAKFTPEGGAIHVTSQRIDACKVAVCVRDNGAGIAPQMLPRIFDAFEQGESRITRQFGGLGLGLAISKALIELHAGAIRAESDGPGTGATFTIELPLRSAPSHRHEPRGGDDTGPRASKLRLLIVEDHCDTAAILGKLLCAAGYAVKTANSAASALSLVSTEPFDLLISDIGLPDATGYELMEQLRRQYAMPGIAMSGYGMDDDIRKSREAGFSDHLVKPINLNQLHDAIKRVTAVSCST